VLLLLGVGGAVYWITGFDMLKMMLLDGVPVFFSHAGNQIQVPGRLVGALVLVVPIVCAVAGIWLLLTAFHTEHQK